MGLVAFESLRRDTPNTGCLIITVTRVSVQFWPIWRWFFWQNYSQSERANNFHAGHWQTCAKIPKRSEILDPRIQDTGSGILQDVGSYIFIFLRDPRDVGSCHDNIAVHGCNFGSHIGGAYQSRYLEQSSPQSMAEVLSCNCVLGYTGAF